MEMTSAEILNWITRYGYIGIFFLLMLGIIGVPVPDEIVLTCSGFLIFKGFLSPELTLSCAFMGSVCGISLSYGLGRFVGMPIILKYGYLVHITPEKVDRVRIWYERFGKWLLLFGYFIAGVRHLTAFTAGAYLVQITRFCPVCLHRSILVDLYLCFTRIFFGRSLDGYIEAPKNGVLVRFGDNRMYRNFVGF